MQLRRWGFSRAGRIVIIPLLVRFLVPLLGLSPILVVPPSPIGDPGPGGQSHGTPPVEAILPGPAVPGPTPQAVVPLEADLDRAARPVPVPLPRWLPRAPPAA